MLYVYGVARTMGVNSAFRNIESDHHEQILFIGEGVYLEKLEQ